MNRFNGVLIFDMDEVLVNISKIIYDIVRSDWSFFGKYLKDVGPLTEKELLQRDQFFLRDWIIKDEYKENKEIRTKIKNKFYKLINTNIYDNLIPTEFARRTIMNNELINSNNIKKIYIVTRCCGNNLIESKKRFIDKFFKNPKVELIIVDSRDNKSDYIKDIDWNLFVDDEIRNIEDVVKNTSDLTNKEFLIPKLGYNKIPSELAFTIEAKGGSVSYYNLV